MARTETTLALDDEVLAAVRARSVQSGRPEHEVVEEALRAYLVADGGEELEDAVRRIQARGDLDEDESLDLAYSELRAMRAERDARQAS
jgi:Arc/MetJ family transcription regulator